MPTDKSLFSMMQEVKAQKPAQEPFRSSDQFMEAIAKEVAVDGVLANRYIVPPFSILDARHERWARKQDKWIPLFDPLLCEIVYRWFAPKRGGHVLDPLAADYTRGIVATSLGYQYTGIQPNSKIRASFKRHATVVQTKMTSMPLPKWVPKLPREQFDLIFTDMPVYRMEEATSACVKRYQRILGQAIARLKQGRMIVLMTRSAIRGEDGFIQFRFGDVVDLMKKIGGTHYYNEGHLLMSGNTRQTLLCFYKGDDFRDIPMDLGFIEDCRS